MSTDLRFLGPAKAFLSAVKVVPKFRNFATERREDPEAPSCRGERTNGKDLARFHAGNETSAPTVGRPALFLGAARIRFKPLRNLDRRSPLAGTSVGIDDQFLRA
jgi:hypothetical protein